MANDKNKIKELVSDDDDPTLDLEHIASRDDPGLEETFDRESDASTFGLDEHDAESSQGDALVAELRADLKSRTKTIGRLQFDIEQLRSRWLGLETEIKAREKIVCDLSQDIADLREAIGRKEKLLKKRDTSIRALKAEIRQRDETHRQLARKHADLQQSVEQSLESTGQSDTALSAAHDEIEALRKQLDNERTDHVVGKDPALRELQAQLSRTEQYADDLRIRLKDIADSHDDLGRENESLTRNLAQATESNRNLAADLTTSKENAERVRHEIEVLRKAHEQEIRILRFELDEAQNTVAETSDLNSQLTSDLLDTRGYKDELERMLCDNEEQSQRRIEKLERNLQKLTRSAEDYEQKLESKSTAINVLLGELTKKSEQIEAIGDIEEVDEGVDKGVDDRNSEHIDDFEVDEGAVTGKRNVGKVTRVLIGRIGDQVLRFPLFKDRLTIGRTEDNDIQLKLSYISRRHAVIMTEGDTTRVIDWGSKNGVYVNSKRVKEHFLSSGDIVAVGNAKFRYEQRKKREP